MTPNSSGFYLILLNRDVDPEEQTMQTTWKSGSLVILGMDGPSLRVVGYDSVGSVICEFPDADEPRSRIYVAPALLSSFDEALDS